MPNRQAGPNSRRPGRLVGAVLAVPCGLLAAISLSIAAATAQIVDPLPNWVDPRYRDFFVRFVDDRPMWQRALDELGVDVGQTGRAFALIAGVSRYPDMPGRHRDLAPARVDVDNMAAYLAAEPESFNEIVVLRDEDVTGQSLRYFLTRYFPRRLAEAPRSRFLFAYSGHGMTAANGRGYLLTSQARSLTDRFHAGISLASLRADFQEVVDEGHQVLALINACYGASFHRLSLAFGGDEDPYTPRREGAHAITAGGSGELAWHDPTFGEGSVFFEALLAALDGRADRLPTDGVVTVGELETYLENVVSRFTDERQNPEGGDLTAARSPGGFFFLDRRGLVESGLVEAFNPETAFGGGRPAEPPAATSAPVLGLRPGEVFRDCAGAQLVSAGDAVPEGVVCGPEMLVVPAGTFTMGSPADEPGREDDEGPQREVPRFALGVHEVTFEEYDACVDAGGCDDRPSDEGWGRGRRPVINVSWRDAQAYVEWLSEQTGAPYRLPSEAEWEYAARAGTTTRYAFGDDISANQANFWPNVRRTTEVASYPANAWGLHDMHGNVWEWVEDCWNETYEGASRDGSALTTLDCNLRVLRGGSWFDNPGNLRSAIRIRYLPDNRSLYAGFRVARTLTP